MGNTRFGWHSGVMHAKQFLVKDVTSDSLIKFSGVLVAGQPLWDASLGLTTQNGAIAVETPSGTKYMPLYNFVLGKKSIVSNAEIVE
jgi:hypothetical protein